MKRFKIFMIMAMMAMVLVACGGKEAASDPQEETTQEAYRDSLVRTCKLSACKIAQQSSQILIMYASGEISLEAASKLIKANADDIKYLYDMKIYSEEDDKYLFALYGNVTSAFDELFEDGDKYLDNVELISKCIDKLLAE